MSGAFTLLAGLTVVAHMAFVAFATLGGLLALRWRNVAWLHVPAAAWAAYIEFFGGICPLTPLENELRLRAGLDTYGTDFVAQYLLPVLYPEGLTRDAQVLIGLGVMAVNVAVYAFVYIQRRPRWR